MGRYVRSWRKLTCERSAGIWVLTQSGPRGGCQFALQQTVGEEVVLLNTAGGVAGGDRLRSDVTALANEVGSAALLRCPLPCAARLDQLSRKSRKNDKIAASDVARPHVNWITLLRALCPARSEKKRKLEQTRLKLIDPVLLRSKVLLSRILCCLSVSRVPESAVVSSATRELRRQVRPLEGLL